MFLCLPILAASLSLFLCIRYIYWLPGLVGWPYVVGGTQWHSLLVLALWRENSALLGQARKKCPCPSTTWLKSVPDLPGAQSQQGRATRSQEVGANVYLVRGRCQSASWESGGMALASKHTQLSHWYPLSLPISLHTSPGSWVLSRVQALQGGDYRESRGWSYYFPPGWCHMEGSTPPKKDGVCCVGKWLSTGVLAAIPSALSSEPQTPDFPCRTWVSSALQEPRVSVCTWDFVHWPFKRASVSLANFHFSLADRIRAAFHSQMYYGYLFPALKFWAGEPGLGLRPHPLRGNPYSWDIPPESQPPPVGAGPALFTSLPFLPVLMWLLR